MFGFKRRPENDINQYFAMIPRDKNWVKNSIEIIKVTDYNRDIALNKEDPFSKNVSIKRAIKYAKKHRAILSISPEGMTENNVFQYIKDHVPRELWKYSALSTYYKFNRLCFFLSKAAGMSGTGGKKEQILLQNASRQAGKVLQKGYFQPVTRLVSTCKRACFVP